MDGDLNDPPKMLYRSALTERKNLGSLREGHSSININKELSKAFAAQDKQSLYHQDNSLKASVQEVLDFVKKNFPNELSEDVAERLGYTRGKSDIEGLRYSLSEEE